MLNRLLDGLKVGERAAEPTLVNPAATGALRLFGDDFASAAFGVDEKDLTAASCEFAHELLGLFELLDGLFQIDDVNLVTSTEDVLSHLGVPETSLVTEMTTGLQHFTHANRHV